MTEQLDRAYEVTGDVVGNLLDKLVEKLHE